MARHRCWRMRALQARTGLHSYALHACRQTDAHAPCRRSGRSASVRTRIPVSHARADTHMCSMGAC